MKKLQILIPQHKETDDVIKPLLDSIEVQQKLGAKANVISVPPGKYARKGETQRN